MDVLESAASPTEETPRKPRHRYWLWSLALILAVLAFLHHRGWSTQAMVLPDGRVIDVINYNDWTSHSATGSRPPERYLWLRYYSDGDDYERMRQEGRGLQEWLIPVADERGLNAIKIEPAQPLLVRAFPIGVTTVAVWLRKEADGKWMEVGTQGDS